MGYILGLNRFNMETREELLLFLRMVVGDEYLSIDEDGECTVEPYTLVLDSLENSPQSVGGSIMFKGTPFEEFSSVNSDVIRAVVIGMNHAYTTAIRDCLDGSPNTVNEYSMSKLKFK